MHHYVSRFGPCLCSGENPRITESTTRLPVNAPLATGPDDPHIQMAVGICFLLFLVGATLQVLKLRGKFRRPAML